MPTPIRLKWLKEIPDFEAAIKNADLIVPDGIGIVLASRILGGRIQKRITGMDIFLGLSNELNKNGGYSCFFLGSTRESLDKIREKMRTDFPNLKVADPIPRPLNPHSAMRTTGA